MLSNLPREISEMNVVNADVESVEKAGDVDFVAWFSGAVITSVRFLLGDRGKNYG
jgi:hypothetical protein